MEKVVVVCFCFHTPIKTFVFAFVLTIAISIRLQLKPVRSLENFKHTSPTSSPERWVLPSRTGAPMASPPKRFFLQPQTSSQDTQNLLHSPDDVFSLPPVPPRIPSRDIFGTTPFVVGGGHSENGDPLFLVANQNSIDIVKLSPPTCSPRRKVRFVFVSQLYHRIIIKNCERQSLLHLLSTSSVK